MQKQPEPHNRGSGCSNMEGRMYRKDKEGKKERQEDMKQLWKLLHSDNECFSENLEWFGRKAIDSEVHRSFEIMFATYLSIMIKVDNRLFLGRTYWDIKSRRVDQVYRLLMNYGYAERIIELALGAANLYAQTKHKGYSSKVTELREFAEWYKLKVEQHRQKHDGNSVSRKAGWNMIRISNRVFAKIFDIVEDGTISGGWKVNTYFKSLEEPTDRDQLHEIYMDTFERLISPRKYRWKKLLNKLKPPIRNKRKKIDWKAI